MALEQKLSLKLAQKLVMTPSLQQAIKLLQMTRLELEGVLTQELVENPVLEDNEVVREEESEEQEEADEQDPMDEIDLEDYFSDYAESWEGQRYASNYEAREGPPLENMLSETPDLYDHLLWQLHMSDVSARQREIAELIIGNLDPDGFLVASLEELQAMGAQEWHPLIEGESSANGDGNDEAGETGEGFEAAEMPPAQLVEQGYSSEEVIDALEQVRSFEPPGVACWTLQESLLLQLDQRGESEDSLARAVIAEHWELFKHRKFDAVAKALGIPLADLEPVVETVRTLETRPGREFNTDRTHYVEPDVHIVKVSEEYVVQLNDDGLPRLRVSRAYRKMMREMSREGKEGDAKQYIKDKMRSAMWLIKSLDQRQRTIYKVAESIVKQQRAFFDHGIEHLRPMVLRDVAEDIEMHESTVSRVVSNKYMHTPRGLFPMKFFFHSGIDREYGGDISSLTVKRKIETLIQDEDSKKPHSDSELMRILNREGIHIARRTVAKYRDELGIPSSTERKQIF